MPAPLNPNLWPSVLHDEDAIPISPTNPLPVTVISGGGSTPNRSAFTTNQKTVAVPGTAEQFQTQAVPNGFTVFLEALDGNTGNIYIGGTQADAQNHTVANVLSAGAFRTLALTNTDEIWIDADVAGEGAQWTVEV